MYLDWDTLYKGMYSLLCISTMHYHNGEKLSRKLFKNVCLPENAMKKARGSLYTVLPGSYVFTWDVCESLKNISNVSKKKFVGLAIVGQGQTDEIFVKFR